MNARRPEATAVRAGRNAEGPTERAPHRVRGPEAGSSCDCLLTVITGPDGLVLGGFPAEVLAEFWVYSLLNQALMWLVIGATAACLAALWPSMRRDRRVVRFG